MSVATTNLSANFKTREKKCNAKGGLTNVSSANERLLGDKCNAKLMRSKIGSYS